MKLLARALQPRSLMSLASRTCNCLMMRCGLEIIWHSGQGAFGHGHMYQGPYRDQKISLSLSFITAQFLSLLCTLVSSDPLCFVWGKTKDLCLQKKPLSTLAYKSRTYLHFWHVKHQALNVLTLLTPTNITNLRLHAPCVLLHAGSVFQTLAWKAHPTKWKLLHDRQVQDKLQPFKEDKRGN